MTEKFWSNLIGAVLILFLVIIVCITGYSVHKNILKAELVKLGAEPLHVEKLLDFN